MDIISGHGNNSERNYSVDELVDNWSKHYSTLSRRTNTGSSWLQHDSLPTAESDQEFHSLVGKVVKERGANLFKQFWFSHNLSLLQQYRTISGFTTEVFVALFAGLILGLSMGGQPETYFGLLQAPFTSLSSAPNFWLTVQLSMLVGMGAALAAAPAGVRVFSEELPVYWRNVSSGHSAIAYFLAKVVSSFYRLALCALHFSAVIFYLSTPVTSSSTHFIGCLGMFYGVYGLSAFISMVARVCTR